MTERIRPPNLEHEPWEKYRELMKYREQLCTDFNTVYGRVASAQADSTATDVAGIVVDHNALLAKLRTAGLMST